MPKNYVRENVPLSRFGVLVAQLESIVASAGQQPPDALLCFDLLSDLVAVIDEEPKESILLWQRKCEDTLYSLLTIGARRPVRHLASVAMGRIISKGDVISIYSRASSLQGFLTDGKRNEPMCISGAVQCLGELYWIFGRRITSGLLETTIIVAKLLKFHEDFVRQESLHMLQNALIGSEGGGTSSAYAEAFRLIMRFAVGDKSFVVRIAAARCLKAFATIGCPGLGVGEFENAASYCVKALEDTISSVRDSFGEALSAFLALGMHPEAQIQPRGRGNSAPAKKLEGDLQRHLQLPFVKASGTWSREIRIGITFSWVCFLQVIRLQYLQPDSELQSFSVQVMDMLHADDAVDAHALACVVYILRVGIVDQMTEQTQRNFLVFLGKQLQSPDVSPSMMVAALRTLACTLKTLGEAPQEFREVLDSTVAAAVSNPSQLVRIEAAYTLRVLAEVDPPSVVGLISYGLTVLSASRESISFKKDSNLKVELDSLHGQATALASLILTLPKLPLGYPARLMKSILDVLKRMLIESSRNSEAATVEEETGWLLLSSLLASMPREELEDQVFDILSLWASVFSGNPEYQIKQVRDLTSIVCVWSAAIDALTAFIRCFICPTAVNMGIFLEPVLLYLSRALSYVALVAAKEQLNTKPAMDIFVTKILLAYRSLPDPRAYKSDHPQIIQLCTTPFRDASWCEESSCLRLLLDKRDACLGPWIPGRDWFEDELRAFQGGKDGPMPCVWENELSSFPLPESITKSMVNQMLLCFGLMFASQHTSGMLSLITMIEQCLKSGKKQPWHAANITNVCVGLLAGLKALLALRSQPLGLEVLSSVQAIFQSILAEGDICASQRRASSEGLGLLARLGNDIFTARMTSSLLADLSGVTDANYAGSIALALGCIHRSAGGMALSSLVPATVNSISSLAKSSVAGLKIWSMHGLLLTIEAAGLSYVSQVQATLNLALEILLSEENWWADLQQEIGRLVNAVVAVLGPELSPGSIFFSRCKSVVAEISSYHETATLLESARFTQQLVLFAPQAVSVDVHVQTLICTFSARQPTLRYLAVSTLRHLIEKDPVSIIDEQIEDNLFHMLDEETDLEIENLVRAIILRLLYASCPSCPSRWILICRNMILAASTGRTDGRCYDSDKGHQNGFDGETRLNIGADDENMVSSSRLPNRNCRYGASTVDWSRDRHLRYRTRLFAAECLSHLPAAVGVNASHFDLSLARKQRTNRELSGDWLVFHLQELVSLAYQISTIQFESMQPIGVGLLSTIIEKFERISDPELPGHLLLEQYQAQLVSAVRTALGTSSGPILLEAGLQLATKMLTSGVISGDQVAIKRIYALLSRPLDEFKDIYYPSFAEWVACKIKIRLLAAHASLKCYTYTFLRRCQSGVPEECLALLPLFSKSSSFLGKYWICTLRDYTHLCFRLHLNMKWKPFLDGIKSPVVSLKLGPCLEEAWPVILQAVALDAIPTNIDVNGAPKSAIEKISSNSISGYSMVELELEDFRFLWGFALFVLFQRQNPTCGICKMPEGSSRLRSSEDSPIKGTDFKNSSLYESVLLLFQCLATKGFFSVGFLTINNCHELLQVLSYSIYMDDSWNNLAIPVLSQIVQNCPEDFLEVDNFFHLAMELCLVYLFRVLSGTDALTVEHGRWEDLLSALLSTAKRLMDYLSRKKSLKVLFPFLLMGYKCIQGASTELCFSKATDFVQYTSSLLKKNVDDKSEADEHYNTHFTRVVGACVVEITSLSKGCIRRIHLLENKKPDQLRLLQMKLAFSVEHTVTFAKLTHEAEMFRERKDNSLSLTILRHCIASVQDVISDSNLQVQAIGLQVLKGMVQRGADMENNYFLILFIGELLHDVFMIIQQMLKKPLTRESVAIVGECLRLLMLLQTLPTATDFQKALMNLALEAITMVFSASEDVSQEVNYLNSTVVKIVSLLAQNPSSALHFKDAMLSMPPMHRQQLQALIRASVTQDQKAAQTESPVPSLEIKLPSQKFEGKEQNPSVSHSDKEEEEDDEEEDDDWDSFQSFSTSREEPKAEKPSTSDSKAEDHGMQESFITEEQLPLESTGSLNETEQVEVTYGEKR